MIPLESPVPEIGTPGSESGGRKRAHGCRTAALRESAGQATEPLPATRLPSTLQHPPSSQLSRAQAYSSSQSAGQTVPEPGNRIRPQVHHVGRGVVPHRRQVGKGRSFRTRERRSTGSASRSRSGRTGKPGSCGPRRFPRPAGSRSRVAARAVVRASRSGRAVRRVSRCVAVLLRPSSFSSYSSSSSCTARGRCGLGCSRSLAATGPSLCASGFRCRPGFLRPAGPRPVRGSSGAAVPLPRLGWAAGSRGFSRPVRWGPDACRAH